MVDYLVVGMVEKLVDESAGTMAVLKADEMVVSWVVSLEYLLVVQLVYLASE